MIVKTGGSFQTFYAHKDHLGSIVALTNNAATVVAEQNFDAWGRVRNPATWTYTGMPALPSWLYRGYTGHEHLPQFGLVNMNARLYDPVFGRMCSPDNYVQRRGSTQAYNRYSYCVNNPVRYTDPTGEFFVWDSFIAGLGHGFIHRNNGNRFQSAWRTGAHRAYMDLRIWGGLGISDRTKTFGGQALEIASRFTWQLPQTLGGFYNAHLHNSVYGDVRSVDYLRGSTVISSSLAVTSAVTMGSYIIGNREIAADPHNSLFQHEYGHYLQSQKMGFAYFPRVGIPSARGIPGDGNNGFSPQEIDANRLAFLYFSKDESFRDLNLTPLGRHDGIGWDYDENRLTADPVDIIIDYNDVGRRNSISSTRSAFWYDYASWAVPLWGPIFVGFGNSWDYRGEVE